MKREELSIPSVRDCVALHMGGLHSLTLPLPKMPTFLFKTLAKFLQQLTGTRQPPVRRPHSCTPTATEGGGGGGGGEQDAGLPDDVLFSPQPGSLATSQLFGSTSSICSVHETQPHLFKFVNDWRLVEEFEWLRTTFFGNMDRFPVRFCHNDIQENNLLLYKDPSQRGWYRILTIDYEYSSYNFRCIDVGNFFNEWTYDNTYPHAPGFAYYPDAYPSREEQLAFWRKYLTVYQFAECAGRIPGTYIQHSRRVHSQSVCTQSKMEIVKLLRSPPSAPIFNENSEIGDCDACNTTTNYCDEDPALRCLSDLEEVRELEEVTLTPEQEEALTLESTYGALFSHIWWAVWALIQAQISSFEFGFIEYAESRMTAYYNLKKTLPASEFPNHENPSPDIPSLRKTSEQLFTMDPVSRVYKNGENKMSSSSFYIEEGDVD
ncbi:unnamed protein product [Rodentolepis nana]|uniref:Choline kinase N-terminal domain-containing protein n=1 Tax=Rodentolepis nana TaxID=102285 RepID=A0A3P7T659_RODNA|nr:unnamed protein product [Rodentolepis nana]